MLPKNKWYSKKGKILKYGKNSYFAKAIIGPSDLFFLSFLKPGFFSKKWNTSTVSGITINKIVRYKRRKLSR